MEKLLTLRDRRLGEVKTFLSTFPYSEVEGNWCINCRSKAGELGVYQIIIDDKLVKFMKNYDHDCKATPEDGCSFCSMLLDLGLIEDREPEIDLKGGEK